MYSLTISSVTAALRCWCSDTSCCKTVISFFFNSFVNISPFSYACNDSSDKQSCNFLLPNHFYLCKFFVIFHKEGQILIRYINWSITTVLLVLLLCVTPTRKSVFQYLQKLYHQANWVILANFVFNIFRRVCQEYGGCWITCRHFRPWALQCWKEGGVKQCWLMKIQPWSNVPGHSKVRVLQQQLHVILFKWSAHCYSTWSIAQGMRQRMSLFSPKIWGKVVGNEGAACTAGNPILPNIISCVIIILLSQVSSYLYNQYH